jgi:hypothetical protein
VIVEGDNKLYGGAQGGSRGCRLRMEKEMGGDSSFIMNDIFKLVLMLFVVG